MWYALKNERYKSHRGKMACRLFKKSYHYLFGEMHMCLVVCLGFVFCWRDAIRCTFFCLPFCPYSLYSHLKCTSINFEKFAFTCHPILLKSLVLFPSLTLFMCVCIYLRCPRRTMHKCNSFDLHRSFFFIFFF